MKKIAVIISLLTIFGATTNQVYARKSKNQTVYFQSNMHCENCRNKLFEHLRFEKGIKDLEVDNVSNTVKVVYIDKKISEEEVKKSIEKAGYQANRIAEAEYKKLVDEAKKN
ncbi:MAG: heavy-metal-associated domain-containing protein [Prolixibacteraceae bacterium]|nr:heavy-metal-associated domain-containing protein [Prolixibacteraceae bacterium]